MISQAALVHTTVRIQNSKAVDFRTVFAANMKLAWPVFLLNFFTRFILYGGLVILLIPFTALLVYGQSNDLAMFGITVLAFIVSVPLAMIMNFVLKYALVYLVTEKISVWPAFVKAFKLFWRYWFVSIEMAIIMFVISVLFGLAVFVAIFFLAVPFLALVVLFAALQQLFFANLALILAVIILLVLIILAGSWLAVFQYSSWTLLFIELQQGRAFPKLLRWAARK